MRLRIYQPDNGTASAAVRICFNNQLIGTLGPGDLIDATIPHNEDFPYKITADCGMFHAALYGHKDTALQVHWAVRDLKMILKAVDSGSDPYLVGIKQGRGCAP